MTKINYFHQTRIQLESSRIIELIQEVCSADISRSQILDSSDIPDEQTISKTYKRLSEFSILNSLEAEFPIYGVMDCTEICDRIHVENYAIQPLLFNQIRRMCANVGDIKKFFKSESRLDALKELNALSMTVFYDQKIELEIGKIIDEKGEVRSDASPALRKIREQKRTIDATIQKAFLGSLSAAKQEGFLHEIAESVRNGRRVLAVLAESKRSVKGIIHDESESGKIIYIEPNATIYLNNEATELEGEERREIQKILIELTSKLRPYSANLLAYQNFLVTWDILMAKYRFMIKIGGSIPKISKKIVLRKAFHPILKLNHLLNKKEVVPFDLNLQNKRMLMISGPNAGGKSITLKTIGITAWMVQQAIPIPAEGDSEFPIFNQILGDIGDLQSVDDELSTYSSKLKLWKFIQANSKSNALLLFDELGNGTDPSFGAGMARALIEFCLTQAPYIIATTHYQDLKKMGDEHEDILNGSMLFDEAKLEPLFKLVLDKPGSSYTFHIAQKIGLPKSIIDRAKELSHSEQVNYEKQLLKLELKEKELYQRSNAMEQTERDLKKQMKDWNRLHLDLDLSRKKAKYEKLLHHQEVEQQKSSEIKAFKANLKQIEKDRIAEEEKIIAENLKKAEDESKNLYRQIHKVAADHSFKVGDTVQYIQTQSRGVIEKIEKTKAIVIFENMKSSLSLQDLIPISTPDEQKKYRTTKILSRSVDRSRELDLRGKFIYEAIPELEDFINQALINNFHEVKIIHGVGKLRQEILKTLKSIRAISKVNTGTAETGGEGASAVVF
jgi:DNA mismatch repair protein MutS2